jgi:predicted ATP-grasp superfamily ATP-dependent carboligase
MTVGEARATAPPRGAAPDGRPVAPAAPPAIVLGGSANAVSVARSLTSAGVEVYTLGAASSPVRHSRACGTFVEFGGGVDVQAQWLHWLMTGPRRGALLPCSDEALEMIVRNRERLVDLGYRPFEVDDEVALVMLDKARTYALARELGISAPLTLTVRTVDDVARVGDEIGYPCALKPLHSHVFQRHCGARTKAFVVVGPEELLTRFLEMSELGVQMLATEIIPGADDRLCGYYTYLDERGEPLFHFTKRKLRQYPVGFGTGSYHITSWDPDAVKLGLAFLQGAGVRGLANVEFKRDPRDGALKLIECNHRFTAPNELVRIAGLDLGLFVYNKLAGRPAVAPQSYRTGVRLWHPIEDTRAFLTLRRRGEITLAGWVASVARPTHMSVFRWEDPSPSVRTVLRRARGLWRRRPAAARP